MLLIKNIHIYSPENLGIKDILISGKSIYKIKDKIEISSDYAKIIDGSNKILIPGIVDKHIHVTGGGGEGGMTTRVPAVKIKDLIKNGITTVVGLLGTDNTTRTLRDLYAKTKSINELGLTAYALASAYKYPIETLTSDLRTDMCYINECIGCKIAISDHRSSCVNIHELRRVATDVYIGGKLSAKQGVFTLHVGDSDEKLNLIFDCLENSDLPKILFQPTHCNRNENLLNHSLKFLKEGGYIDLTCGISKNLSPASIVKKLKKENYPLSHITMTSDGNGSFSTYDKDGKLLEIGASNVNALYKEMLSMTQNHDIPLEEAIRYISTNPAQSIGIGDKKGCIKENYDADLLLLDKEYKIESTIAKGEILMHKNEFLKLIPFE